MKQAFTSFMAAPFDELSPQSRTPWPMHSSRGRTCHRCMEPMSSNMAMGRERLSTDTE